MSTKPLITANMVTFARLVFMPLVCWFILQQMLITAVIVGTIIGCTDFIDGYMARRQGPTILGGLMDPIADKVFIGFAYIPLVYLGFDFIPPWTIAVLFLREYLVTALRSVYEKRDMRMKTSYLAKVKTWTQMQGLGMIVLFYEIQNYPRALLGIMIAAVVLPFLAFIVFWLIKRKVWRGALVMCAFGFPLLYCQLFLDLDTTIFTIILCVITITWASGMDYLWTGLRELKGRKDLDSSDYARIVGAILLPIALFVILNKPSVSAWYIVFIVALELAVGGLDNLLSHHRAAANAMRWGIRAIGAPLLILATLYVAAEYSIYCVASATAISAIGVALEFWRGRPYYVDRIINREAAQS